MTTLSKSLLEFDLDFLISETGQDFTGVTPAAIAGKVFRGAISVLEDGYEVELSGHQVILDSKLTINSASYEDLPEKGAVLTDPEGTKHKVAIVNREHFSPCYVLTLTSQYASGA